LAGPRQARDAIHAALDVPRLEAELRAQAGPLHVHSRAHRPHHLSEAAGLGRVIDPNDIAKLRAEPIVRSDVCIVIGDGLSSLAVERHAAALLAALKPSRK
jgi:ethanolamine ammonia-lyase small subunit